MAGVTSGLRTLLGRLTTYKVVRFGSGSESEETMDLGEDRETTDLAHADVASSLVRDERQFKGPARHVVVLDIDHPAHLVDSTTPGHHHLYVEIPPVDNLAYFAFLRAAAEIGLIERGYAEVSIKRGHSDVRLPWVMKDGEHGFKQVAPAAAAASPELDF